jgi:hypothetical protein
MNPKNMPPVLPPHPANPQMAVERIKRYGGEAL